MVWGIDQESAAALAAVNYRPHYGLGRVTFRVSHGQSSVRVYGFKLIPSM